MLRFQDVKAAASGRWEQILISQGIAPEYLTGKHTSCPICTDTTDTFRWDKTKERFFCARSGDMGADGFDLIVQVNGIEVNEALKSVAEYLGVKHDSSPEARARAREYARQAEAKKLEVDLRHEMLVLMQVLDNRAFYDGSKDHLEREIEAARKIYKLLRLLYGSKR